MDRTLSDAIKILRFPLIFLVVVFHCRFSAPETVDLPIFDHTSSFLNQMALRWRVPCFFIISGFLFFANINNFTFGVYRSKLNKRVQSLVIPYFLWITLLLLINIGLSLMANGYMESNYSSALDYTPLDYLFAYISGAPIHEGTSHWYCLLTGYGGPLLFPFWFLRNLIICVILTPVIYAIIKKSRVWSGLLLMTVLVSSAYWTFLGCYLDSLLWFAIGAWLSIQKINVSRLQGKNNIILAYFTALIAGLIFDLPVILHPIITLMGVTAIFIIALNLANRGFKMPPLLIESTFFIYAFHFFIVHPITGKLNSLLPPDDILYTVTYLIYPILVTLVCLAFFKISRKISPRSTSILCGNRTSLSPPRLSPQHT